MEGDIFDDIPFFTDYFYCILVLHSVWPTAQEDRLIFQESMLHSDLI